MEHGYIVTWLHLYTSVMFTISFAYRIVSFLFAPSILLWETNEFIGLAYRVMGEGMFIGACIHCTNFTAARPTGS